MVKNEKKGVLLQVSEEDVELLETNPQEFWKGITDVLDYAFNSLDNLTSIDVPEGVTKIGESAFANCQNLESVTLPSSLKTLGKNAFSYCKHLKTVSMSSETVVEKDAFKNLQVEIKYIEIESEKEA